jgi:hypothetical protein
MAIGIEDTQEPHNSNDPSNWEYLHRITHSNAHGATHTIRTGALSGSVPAVSIRQDPGVTCGSPTSDGSPPVTLWILVMVLTLKNDFTSDATSIGSAVKRHRLFMTFLSALYMMSDCWAMGAMFQCRNVASGTPKEGRT